MLQLKSVSKVYKTDYVSTIALKQIDLTVADGDFVSIMGTSGSGKTTLLNIIGGMDTVTSGEYIFNGQHIEHLKPKELTNFRKANVGFVFQNFALMNHYTVFENVEMPLLMKRMSAGERKETVYDALKKTGIIEYAEKNLCIYQEGNSSAVPLQEHL